jgi:hypothetical protein
MSQREHEAAEKLTVPANAETFSTKPSTQNTLRRLQSQAGNHAVTRAITVQRNGSYLDQLPKDLLPQLGAFTAHESAGNTVGALSQAMPNLDRSNAVRLGRRAPFQDYFTQLQAMRQELLDRQAAVRAARPNLPAGTREWIKNWVDHRVALERALMSVRAPAEGSQLWDKALDLLKDLPRTVNAVYSFLTNG